MRLLLDTHALIWLVEADSRLPLPVLRAIETAEGAFVSLASHWEMAIKLGIGKLDLRGPLADYFNLLEDWNLALLSPGFIDIERLVALPSHHRDPFDRMLVAQAMTHGLTIVTKDPNIPRYGVPVLW